MASSPTSNVCPCGSGSELSSCCLPLIQGKKKAKTAEELLRSRYTAFTRGDVDFILDTHHSKTKKEVSREEIADWAKNSEWLGLKIVQQEAGTEKDEQGTIVFCATYQAAHEKSGAKPEAKKPEEHWEQSYFEKEGGEWKFLDAKGIQVGPYRRAEPKTGRNDPCTCGSGKKFKKCHGAV